MELRMYHSIKGQVEGSEGEFIYQICRCTGSQSWQRWERQNERVWVKQRPGRCYGVLNGPLPWQLQQLFKIKLLNEDGAVIEYWLALALTTIPENSGNLDPVSQFVQVRKLLAAIALKVIKVGNIVGCASVSNGSGPSLRVRVRVGTKPAPSCQSGLSIHPNCTFGYASMENSLPI